MLANLDGQTLLRRTATPAQAAPFGMTMRASSHDAVGMIVQELRTRISYKTRFSLEHKIVLS
jgi:hypothetical protein